MSPATTTARVCLGHKGHTCPVSLEGRKWNAERGQPCSDVYQRQRLRVYNTRKREERQADQAELRRKRGICAPKPASGKMPAWERDLKKSLFNKWAEGLAWRGETDRGAYYENLASELG